MFPGRKFDQDQRSWHQNQCQNGCRCRNECQNECKEKCDPYAEVSVNQLACQVSGLPIADAQNLINNNLKNVYMIAPRDIYGSAGASSSLSYPATCGSSMSSIPTPGQTILFTDLSPEDQDKIATIANDVTQCNCYIQYKTWDKCCCKWFCNQYYAVISMVTVTVGSVTGNVQVVLFALKQSKIL